MKSLTNLEQSYVLTKKGLDYISGSMDLIEAGTITSNSSEIIQSDQLLRMFPDVKSRFYYTLEDSRTLGINPIEILYFYRRGFIKPFVPTTFDQIGNYLHLQKSKKDWGIRDSNFRAGWGPR